MSRGRMLAVVAVVGGLVFGFAGGEYGTTDWWRLKRDLAHETTVLDSLRVEIDSLEAEVKLLERDSATQERMARELLGMIRPGEIMFIVEGQEPER